MCARQVKDAFATLQRLNFIGAVQNVIESATDNDVLVEGSMWNERRIGLNGEGKSLEWLPFSDDLKK